jgi:hypothetical protein
VPGVILSIRVMVMNRIDIWLLILIKRADNTQVKLIISGSNKDWHKQ